MDKSLNSNKALAAAMDQLLDDMCTQRTGNPNLAIILHYVFKTSIVAASALAIYLGYRLFIFGITGQASLTVDAKTFNGQLLNAAPGLFFALGGLVGIIVTAWRGVTVKFPTAKPRNSAYFTANSAISQDEAVNQAMHRTAGPSNEALKDEL